MMAKLLAHPLTRGMDLDDPALTIRRREVIRSKPFLRRVYAEWYSRIRQALPPHPGKILEIGSGGGFLAEHISGVITSDAFPCPGVDRTLDACERWPFADAELGAVVMVNVLHHLPDTRRFFNEATRAVCTGGRIVMVEPWPTPWSRFVYTRLHHEPFHPEGQDSSFPPLGPLPGANSALPWIVFKRDREIFCREFPSWRIDEIHALMPSASLLSGGVGMRSLVPAALYSLVRRLEKI